MDPNDQQNNQLNNNDIMNENLPNEDDVNNNVNKITEWNKILETLHRTRRENGDYNIAAAQRLFAQIFPNENQRSRRTFERYFFKLFYCNFLSINFYYNVHLLIYIL